MSIKFLTTKQKLMKAKLFQYAIIWYPTEKQIKDESKKPLVIVELKTILAVDEKGVLMNAAMDIPTEYRGQLEQIEIAVRPF